MARCCAGGKNIRVGVIGVGRGQTFMHQAPAAGMELVAVCDTWEERLRDVGKQYGVPTYTDYDRFLEHDMDAVVTANYFHEHAPFAVKALNAGLHVMSECAACNTMAEGVELCRTVERTGRVYMFAENYPYTAANIELARLYKAGEIGQAVYGEGEYNHPGLPEWVAGLSPGIHHWRNRLPATYYCTHALAPLMAITDTMPKAVNAVAIPRPDCDERPLLRRGTDLGAVILCRMDTGAVFRLFGVSVPGHSIWYRLHGLRGMVEHVRGPGYWGPGLLRIVHDPWDLREGQVTEKTYLPDFPEWAREAGKAGHGGGDFFTNHYFAEAIRAGQQPYLDVYRGVAMSCVGILGWKSVLAGGAPFEMPDFRDESSRRSFEDDHWTPFNVDDPDCPPTASRGEPEMDPEGLALARKVWREMGYTGE